LLTPRFAAALVAAALSACGGGEADTQSGSAVAVYNDLQAAPGTPASTQTSIVCGFEVGPQLLQGVVSAVHDGDTLTVNGTTVRLASIDAPELAQTYGAQSQASLSAMVLGQSVKVAYAQTDRYGRVVGAVFSNTCQYVNLEQVSTGAAWFYRAYQCEVSANARAALDQAEETAKGTRLGLWAEANPLSPWMFRNGVDAAVPACSSSAPVWSGNTALPTTPTYTAPAKTGCYTITVNGYYRSNGTYVQPYTRKSPACP